MTRRREYMDVIWDADDDRDLESTLNFAAQDGWRLHTLRPLSERRALRLVFERDVTGQRSWTTAIATDHKQLCRQLQELSDTGWVIVTVMTEGGGQGLNFYFTVVAYRDQ